MSDAPSSSRRVRTQSRHSRSLWTQPNRCLLCLEDLRRQCDGGYPCGECAAQQVDCCYPRRAEEPTSWTTIAHNVIQRHAESLHLAPGVAGAVVLKGRRSDSGKVRRLDWESATTQREDLRIRQHPLFPPVLVWPADLEVEEELDTLEFEGGPLDWAGDTELLLQANIALDGTLFHPTILLNALLSERPHTSARSTATFQPTSLNFGNTLSVSASNHLEESIAAWRTGDPGGRPTTIATGKFKVGKAYSRHGAVNPDEDGESSEEEDGEYDDPTRRRRIPSRYSSTFPRLSSERLQPHRPSLSPIQQIILAPLPRAADSAPTLCALRTLTTLSLFPLNSPTLSTHFIYPSSHFGRRAIADIALGGINSGDEGSGMVLDESGNLWGFGLGLSASGRMGHGEWDGKEVEMFRIRKGGGGRNGMGRVKMGGLRGLDAVVACEREVLLYDLRAPKGSITLADTDMLSRHIPLGTDLSSSLVTSLCTPGTPSMRRGGERRSKPPSGLHAVCTTRDILLLDERMPGKEIVRWYHGRVGIEGKGVDRTLSLMEVNGESSDSNGSSIERLALHSRIHPLITIHTFDSSASHSSRSLLDPYSLPSPSNLFTWRRTGLAIIPVEQRRAAPRGEFKGKVEKGWMVLESGNDGGVLQRCLTLQEFENVREGQERVITRNVWYETEGVERKVVGIEDGTRVDLSVAFKGMFEMSVEEEGVEQRVVKAGERLKATTKAQLDVGVFTAFDLVNLEMDPAAKDELDPAMQVDDQDDAVSLLPILPRLHSTFTQPSSLALSTAAAVPLLVEAAKSFQQQSGWSRSLFADDTSGKVHLRSVLGNSAALEWQDLEAESRALKDRYNVDSSNDPTPLEQLASSACDQLVMDTTLASRVHSAIPLPPPPSTEGPMNAPFPASEQPSSLHFSFFHPLPTSKITGDLRDHDDWQRPSLDSIGVKMLLSEWSIGTDPRSYTWEDPYVEVKVPKDDSQFASQSVSQRRKRAKDHLAPSSSQAPPSSFAQSPYRTNGRPALAIHTINEEFSSDVERTQPRVEFAPRSSQFFAPPSSPTVFASSQGFGSSFVGGTTQEREKKKAKKRVSGF